jgi:hypothetical protein
MSAMQRSAADTPTRTRSTALRTGWRIFRRVVIALVLLITLTALYLMHTPAPPPLPTSFPHWSRQPTPWRMPVRRLDALPPHTDPRNPFEIDLRGRDLSSLDLRNRAADLAWASFDTATVWPAREKLPAEFDPHRVMELGMNPGLGIRALHERGITGRGVGIAVIDMPMLITHQEYIARLRLYEDIGFSPAAAYLGDHNFATMHGCATASIAAGKTVGVAPEAELYFICVNMRNFPYLTRGCVTLRHYAVAVRRIIAINRSRPADRKIRAISLSIGWHVGANATDGAADINAAIADASAAGIFVTSSSLARTHGLKFHGLGRDPMADPDDFTAYRPGHFWGEDFNRDPSIIAGHLLVPMDHRTLAAPGADDDYAHYGSGGWSWCTPYLAGVYALAAQADPAITPHRFWPAALKTGRTITFEDSSGAHSLGTILDPPALIDSLMSHP